MEDDFDYIENPKFYLVVMNADGSDIKELIFTRKEILKYLAENEETSEKITS